MKKIHALCLVLLVAASVTWAQYSALRIVVRDSSDIVNLTMTIDQDTTLKVLGLRTDGLGWEYMQANWSATAGLQNATPAPSSSQSWVIAPTDTGSAWVKVSMGSVTPDSVLVRVTLGMPQYIVLYPKEGAPGGSNLPYSDPADVVWDSAGKSLPIVAKAFDKANHWLSAYEQATSPVTWKIVEFTGNLDSPTGTITPLTGYKTTLTPTRANNTIFLIANLAEGYQGYRDTMKVTVVPGKPDHLSLEPMSDVMASPHRDFPADSVLIPSNETYRVVYAVIRDVYGNFIMASQRTSWQSLDTAVVTVANGQISLGQGIISRIDPAPRDRAKVVATSLDYPGLRDTTLAIVLKNYYVALRIVAGSGAMHISSLIMNSNQDTTLRVQGQRSTDLAWEYVSASWESSQGLNTVPAAPATAQSWTFSPDMPGTGIIRVTLGDTNTTKPDFLSATFTIGPPVAIETEILTPPAQRIAGDTIVGITRIRNKDGLVPGLWCDTIAFQNTLGTGGVGLPIPTVDGANIGTKMFQCFQNGIDSIKMVLYYAPIHPDSVNKITMLLNGLGAVTDSFRLIPNALSRISLEDFNGNALDSVNLTSPTGSKLIIAAGYDTYGNYRGPENSNWTVNGTLHVIDKPTGVPRVFYETGQVKYDEDGYIRASATGKGGAVVSDSARVVITGRAATLMSAVTHDTSGNGVLDGITLVFDLMVTLPAGTRIQLSNGSYTLVVSSVRGQRSGTLAAVDSAMGLLQGAVGSDSVFTVVLSENNKTVPQTGWKPALTISGVPGMMVVNFYTVTDGAGPVIWSIDKIISSLSDRTQDKVTVTFSEPIGTNGNDFNTALLPAGIFRVWERTTTVGGVDTFIEVAGLLDGITSFYQVENNGSALSFYMSNGQDLTVRDYLNIAFDSSGWITDRNPPLVNGPVADNQRVIVRVRPPFGAVLPGLLKPLPPKLRIMFPGAGSFVFPLPADLAHSRLFFTLYSLSGRVVFKTEVADAGKPVSVKSQIPPGIYLVSLKAGKRQLVRKRLVLFG